MVVHTHTIGGGYWYQGQFSFSQGHSENPQWRGYDFAVLPQNMKSYAFIHHTTSLRGPGTNHVSGVILGKELAAIWQLVLLDGSPLFAKINSPIRGLAGDKRRMSTRCLTVFVSVFAPNESDLPDLASRLAANSHLYPFDHYAPGVGGLVQQPLQSVSD